jgi:5-formyltetrahydrofolate cyclo-ligase
VRVWDKTRAVKLSRLLDAKSREALSGLGKGHYDRVLVGLKKNGAGLIGVGWPMQRVADTIPADDWDVPLDAFASPDRMEWFR